jgi:hypothetical protein
MSLNELDKELHDPDADLSQRMHPDSPFNVERKESVSPGEFQKKEYWVKPKKELGPGTKKIIKIGIWSIAAIFLAALALVGFIKFKESAFSEEKVILEISGPDVADSNQSVEYGIKLKNANRVDLKNASVIFNYSDNFQPEEADNIEITSPGSSQVRLDEIKKRSEREISIKGKFFAPEGRLVYIRAVLEYTPSGLSSAFQAENQLGVSIQTSPIALDILAPLEAADSNSVEYLLTFRNSGEKTFESVRVEAEFPEGFTFASSDPSPSEGGSIWYLGMLSPAQEGKIKINGTLSGTADQGKTIKVSIGSFQEDGSFTVFSQAEKMTKIVASPLNIIQTVNGQTGKTVDAGEVLNYEIIFKNDGEISVRNAIVTAEIYSSVLDFSKLQLKKGSYSSAEKRITWKASDVPALSNVAPGAEGKISFSVPVLDRIPVENGNDKNYTVRTVVKIDSPDIPTPVGSNKIIASNTLDLKLNSKVILEVSGFHNDSTFEKFGPIPPKVGEETSYVIHWKITSVSNDISEARVAAHLPGGVRWKDKISPENVNLKYNERSNEIVWEVGKVKSGTGIISPAEEAVFLVSITPEINQANNEMDLLGPSTFEGKDLFTENDIKLTTPGKNTMLQEDKELKGGYKVAS